MEDCESVLRYNSVNLKNVIADCATSQKSLESLLAVSGGYLSRVINGQRTIDESRARRIAVILAMPFEALFVPTHETQALIEAWDRGEIPAIRGEHAAFWSKLRILDPSSPESSCWDFSGSGDEHNRGKFNVRGKPVTAGALQISRQ